MNRRVCLGFQLLKEYLSRPLIMSKPEVDEVLFAYIVVASHAVSLVLIWVDSGIQRPVYYVSKSLHEAEVRYLPLEKAILVVVHATRKLPHYFQSHTVIVLTQLPFRSLLQSADYTGRIASRVQSQGLLISSTCLVPLSRIKSSPILWSSLLKPHQKREQGNRIQMENWLVKSPYRSRCLGKNTLMVLRTTKDLEWGQF